MNGMTKRAARRRLIRAREIVEKGWAKGSLAKYKGEKVAFGDQATNFCALGAVQQALLEIDGAQVISPHSAYLALDPDTKYFREMLCPLAESVVKLDSKQNGMEIDCDDFGEMADPITGYNDRTVKQKILQAFDMAIERLS